jgi:hypothetical protein
MDITDIYRVFHPPTAWYTFFSAAHGTFSKTDHILGHKTSLSKCKKVEITPCILSNYNRIKLEVESKRNYRKFQKYGTEKFIVE